MKITEDIKYIGVNDHQVDLFEGQYPVPNGMAYNSYVILDEKTAVMDAVDARFKEEWLENLDAALEGRTPDYLIIQHMEPDHSAVIADFMAKYPGTVIVSTAMAFNMVRQFFGEDYNSRRRIVKGGDELPLGKHRLSFVDAAMVHWPEVIMTYDACDQVLFSADAFGKFGALDREEPWEEEARRYYFGIVGKYGMQVQKLLQKAAALNIQTLCPLHGPVLTQDLAHYLGLYDLWSSCQPEKKGVVIAYASAYGHTREAAEALEKDLIKEGCQNVLLYDLARCDLSQAVSDAFCCDTLVLASITYNADVFPCMRDFINRLTERNFQNRKVALIENGSWAPMAARVMKQMFEKSKEITWAQTAVQIKSSMTEDNREQLKTLARELCSE
ncbi:MAG: FprA family A-type flavoprotein [Lachnospiraceae bacterium]|nr:FprA family A-type flavoprotein [Lachnospiraceae bacterium]